MEEDSLEDGALKAYFEEAERKRDRKKKKRKEKRAAREQGKEGDEGASEEKGGKNREGESTKDRNDPSQLTHLNPSCVRTTQKNQTAIAHPNRFQSLENVDSETDSGSDSPFPPFFSSRSMTWRMTKNSWMT